MDDEVREVLLVHMAQLSALETGFVALASYFALSRPDPSAALSEVTAAMSAVATSLAEKFAGRNVEEVAATQQLTESMERLIAMTEVSLGAAQRSRSAGEA